jgi:hypothetical protein
VRGLEWLARVGPAGVDAWACAMGWGRRAAFSHAERLEREGWLARYPMTLGHGLLLVATRVGVSMTGLPVVAAGRPAPTWWAHLEACAWTAAWLTARGRELQGCREVAADASWRGELSWRDGKGRHRAGHRPDLAWRTGGGRVAVEVELARKATPRLEAILGLHARWRAGGRTGGVIYVCADEAGCERIRELGAQRGLNVERGGGLRVEPLERIREQAREASRTAASAASD